MPNANVPKKRLLLIPLLIAISLFLAISNFNPAQPGRRDAGPETTLDYRAWSEGITTVVYDESGALNYTLQAERQLVRNDDSSQLEQPFIRLYEEAGEQWNISAESGRIFAQQELHAVPSRRIEFLGNVEILILDKFGNPALLNTEHLLVDPDSETAETELPVTLQTSNIAHSATGLHLDFENERMTFLRDNKGSYAPDRR